MLLPELLADEAFRLFLVFCRVGAALLILPGFGEPYVPPRLRLLLALALSLLLGAALGPGGGLLPAAAPEEPAALALLVGREVLIGLFLGAAARTLLGALHVAGSVIAYQSGLAAASVFDPGAATQGTLPGNLLTTAALVLLFVTDGHHALLAALADSYVGLAPSSTGLPLGDMAELFGRLVGAAFAAGVRIAAPVVLVSLLLYLGLGVLNRLMPALQVFFIALPLQILLAFAVLALSLAGGLLAFLAFFGDGLALLVFGGGAG